MHTVGKHDGHCPPACLTSFSVCRRESAMCETHLKLRVMSPHDGNHGAVVGHIIILLEAVELFWNQIEIFGDHLKSDWNIVLAPWQFLSILYGFPILVGIHLGQHFGRPGVFWFYFDVWT
jgi:hypothetical protein